MRTLFASCWCFAALALLSAIGSALDRQRRIVGGELYPAGLFPYSVSIWYLEPIRFTFESPELNHYCGGSLLNDRWILTLATCFNIISDQEENPEAYRVAIGMHNQTDDPSTFQLINISASFVYPDTILNISHIALARLDEPVRGYPTIDYNTDPNCPRVGQTCKTVGWGSTNDTTFVGSDQPHVLQLKIRDTDECNATYHSEEVYNHTGRGFNIDDSMICASVFEDGKGPCIGDGGSPLLCKCGDDDDEDDLFDDQGYSVVGVLFFGLSCTNVDHPPAFIRTSKYAEFIEQTIQCNT